VIHLAARVGGLFRNLEQNLTMYTDNVRMNLAVLSAAAKVPTCEKVVSMLSTCVFPDKVEYPLVEETLHGGPPHSSNYGYAYAKRDLEVLSRLFSASEPTKKFVSVIPTNLFGPHDNFNVQDGHVLPGLMYKARQAAQAGGGGKLEVWGSGRPLRQFLFAPDLGRMLLFVLDNYDDVAEPVILSVGEKDEVTIAHAAGVVAAASGLKDGLTFLKDKADGQYRKPASPAKFLRLYREATGEDFVFTGFEDAVRETVAWFNENYESARK
jgi:GDP-L-fucose synthase